ncbi:hypothetical protein SUGI_0888030 [Cryptomeria japonica]|uniref:(R)-mandelonitrile lyase-like n=1 Tax=Cryptomeria japonica TaxID=3369 RepID=UPI002414C45A|nr:(R)-mandelonitrile lyase-like [Cryptomeria japonica]GLJ42841.1 hypothetical protein SUGI_0888030 [Cryptomeria japonica]
MRKISGALLVIAWTQMLSIAMAVSQTTGEPVYASACYNAIFLPPSEQYDYIIVGGGTAGCPLAATLSKNFKVLLLERGGLGYNVPTIEQQEGFIANLINTHDPDSPAETFISEEGVVNARGRVLGGSSSINAGFYSRAGLGYVREAGWDKALVNESYTWVEKAVVSRPVLKRWQGAFRNGLFEGGLKPYNGFTVDHVKGTKIGGSTFDRHGRRHSSKDLLQHANYNNLRVGLHATVYRILFHDRNPERPGNVSTRPRAYGVEYKDSNGLVHTAVLSHNGGDIIISSGALGSPQLLLLSGVGPKEHLDSLGIPVVLDLPGVGQGMADNPRNGIALLSSLPLEYSLIQVVGITETNFIEASSIPIQIPFGGRYAYLGTIIEKVVGPLSKGELRLRTGDIEDKPSVRFNYFSHPQDIQNCVDGLRTIGKILKTSSLKSYTLSFIGPPLPANTSNFTAMEEFCRDTVSTIWHYHGGCQVGSVVNEDYRVKGIDSLRVIDGSTFNKSPGTNPQATVMMLGRYMGMQVLKERLSNSKQNCQYHKFSQLVT